MGDLQPKMNLWRHVDTNVVPAKGTGGGDIPRKMYFRWNMDLDMGLEKKKGAGRTS